MENFFTLIDISRITIVLTFSLILSSVIYNWIKNRKYPPGPIGLPLIGYALFLGKNPHLKLRDLSKKYGDIFSFYIGPKLNICVTEYHLVKEILSHPSTLCRPPQNLFQDHLGLSGLRGELWKEQRRFVMQTMRSLGYGKGFWETMIQEEVVYFIKHMKKSNGQPIFFDDPLHISLLVSNVSLLFGRHLNKEAEKEDIEVMLSFGKAMLEHITATNINVNVPELVQLLRLLNIKGLQNFKTLFKRYESIFEKEVKKRFEKKEENTKDDFIGCYLKEIDKRGEAAESQGYTVENLMGNLRTLLVAGNDAIVSAMCWLLLLMAKHQDIQKKVSNEIDEVLGRDGTVYYEDKLKMPYTTATILESIRWASTGALFPPRYTTETFTFKGYEIPEGSHILCNGWAMMHDPRYFEDPMHFNPERFLTKDGSVKLSNVDGYGPFSFGKRSCPGDSVAMMSTYLYFVGLMQKFNVKTPDGVEPDMSYRFSTSLVPKQKTLCFIER